MTFLDDGASIGTVPLTFGTARLTTDGLAAGSHPIVASFVGSDGLAGSTGASPMLTQVVTSAATTTAVTSDVDPSAVGAAVTFTATVAPVDPRLAFRRHRDVPRRDDRSRQRDAQWRKRDPSTSTLTAGVHDITARYNGDASFTGSTSSVLQQHVGTPTAIDDQATLAEDADPTRIDVLDNDTDPDGVATLSIVRVSDPDHGTASIDDAGTPGDPTDDTVLYQPDHDFYGTDGFTYTISDGTQEASANVAIVITPVNDPPVAVAQVVAPEVPAGTTRTITLTATDVDGPNLTFAIVDLPGVGSLGPLGTASCTVVGGGVTCTATVDYTAMSGSDSFTFRVNDGQLDSNIDTVTIDVSGTPNPPPDPDPGTYPSPAGGEGSAIALHGTIVNGPRPTR